jgi:hypothetical protein
MKGVSMLAKENTTTYYERTARAIKFIAANSIPRADVFRLRHKRKASNSTVRPPILLKFINNMYKSDFHNNYFKHLNLKLSDLGFEPSKKRIYISENIPKSCQTIFVEAKRKNIGCKVFWCCPREKTGGRQLDADQRNL